MPVRYDEVWSVPARRIEEYFKTAHKAGCEISVTSLPERALGKLSFPQTRVVIDGDCAEDVHRAFSINFLCGGA